MEQHNNAATAAPLISNLPCRPCARIYRLVRMNIDLQSTKIANKTRHGAESSQLSFFQATVVSSSMWECPGCLQHF